MSFLFLLYTPDDHFGAVLVKSTSNFDLTNTDPKLII